jgi:hypothetical protein
LRVGVNSAFDLGVDELSVRLAKKLSSAGRSANMLWCFQCEFEP